MTRDIPYDTTMRFTLLGCGTSTGVPIPGCRCRVCTSTDPKNFRNRTSALITTDDGFSILIDAGPDLRHQAIRWQIERVDAVIYTHAHADHILGTDDLRSFNFVHGNRIPCYGTHATLEGIKRCFPYIFTPDPTYRGGLLAQLDLHEIQNSQSFTVGGAQFTACELLHGHTHVTGLRCGEVAYATDVKSIPSKSRETLYGARYLFLDGLRYEEHPTHLTIPEAIAVSRELGAQQTFLIHTTHTVDYTEVSSQLPSGVVLGYDGLQIDFN